MTNRYVYKITCTSGKYKDHYYIGCHKTDNIDDGYKGSGKKIRDYFKKYPNDYIKEILEYFDNDEDMFNAEYLLIHPCLNDPLCLNIKEGGSGGSYKGINKGIKHSNDWNEKVSKNNWLCNLDSGKYDEIYKNWCETMKVVQKNPEVRQKHRDYKNEYYKTHESPMKDRIMPESEKNQISISLKRYYNINGHPSKGKKQSEETKKKNSEAHKKLHIKWMTDGYDSLPVPMKYWGEFIDIGFILVEL